MNEFQNAMHDFVQASNLHADVNLKSTLRDLEQAERGLAAAGDRLESVMRQMMREEAERPEWENG